MDLENFICKDRMSVIERDSILEQLPKEAISANVLILDRREGQAYVLYKTVDGLTMEKIVSLNRPTYYR